MDNLIVTNDGLLIISFEHQKSSKSYIKIKLHQENCNFLKVAFTYEYNHKKHTIGTSTIPLNMYNVCVHRP